MSEFDKWFPNYKKTKCAPPLRPRLRLVAFPSAGSAENIYMGDDRTAFDGAARGRRENTLVAWARAHGVELLCAQPPGRELRFKEPRLPSAAAVAAAVLPTLAPLLAEAAAAAEGGGDGNAAPIPWALLGHSVGTWLGYELLRAARTAGLPPPAAWVVSCFPSPDLAPSARPLPAQGVHA